jgi:hypothetical protein
MDKVYDESEIEWRLVEDTRDKLRKEVVYKFLSEGPGYWKEGIKHVTRFKYFVEKLEDGRRIFLLRPTFLNKGIDFQVWVEKLDGYNDKRPSHKTIFEDLKLKKTENPQNFTRVIQLIDEVWNCNEPDLVIKKEDKDAFHEGLPLEMLLKILKWLFIEQDITYWNYDGRQMLRMAIDEKIK